MKPAGSVSVTVTVDAGCGPLLRGVNVKVAVWPLSAGLGDRVFPMARSAPATTVTLAVTVLAGLGSAVSAEAVTVLVSVPVTAPVTCPTMEISGAVAPFASIGQRPDATLTEKAVNQIFERLDWFLHSKGLRQYKLKFEPRWEDTFVAYQGGPVGLIRIGLTVNRIL